MSVVYIHTQPHSLSQGQLVMGAVGRRVDYGNVGVCSV